MAHLLTHVYLACGFDVAGCAVHGIDAWGELRFSNEVAALSTRTESSDPSMITATTVARQTKATRHRFYLSRFSQLVNPNDRTTSNSRTTKASLVDLINAKAIVPGASVISIRGKESETAAELTPEGTIIFKGRTFKSPSAFGKFGLGKTQLSGWMYMMYRAERSSPWCPLVPIRERYANIIRSNKSFSTTSSKKRIKLDTRSAKSKKNKRRSARPQKNTVSAQSPKLRKKKAGSKSAKSKRKVAKKARKKRTVKVDLYSLIQAKMIVPGVGVITARDREAKITADLTPEGNIIFKGVEFTSPSGFAKVALGKKQLNGWLCTLYRRDESQSWRSIMDIRTKAVISGALTAATQEHSHAGGTPNLSSCGGAGPEKRYAEGELDNPSADKRPKSN